MVELPTPFEAIVANAADAIVYADAEGIIRYWNRGAENIFGFSASEALGASLDLIIPERLRTRHWEGYRRVMATGMSRYGGGEILAVPARHRSGRRLSIEFTIVPVRDGVGRLRGMAAILRDVTKRFEEMKVLRERLEEATALRGRPDVVLRARHAEASGAVEPAAPIPRV